MNYIIYNETLKKIVINADSDRLPPDNIFIAENLHAAQDALVRIIDIAQMAAGIRGRKPYKFTIKNYDPKDNPKSNDRFVHPPGE